MTDMKTDFTSVSRRPQLSVIPSHRLLGHIGQMRTDPLKVVVSAMNRREPIARIRLGVISGFFLFDPTDIRRVMMDDGSTYAKTTRGYEKLRILLGNGLVTSNGDFWLRQRRIAQPSFHRKCIESFASSMTSAAVEQCRRWRSAAQTGAPIDVAEAMNLVTLRIAGETLMSVDLTGEGREVATSMAYVLERFNEIVGTPLPWPEYWPSLQNLRLWRAVKTLKGVTDRIIHDRRLSGAQVPDLLGMFMAATDPESGERMDDDQLRDEVITMLLAGHETTANGLTWMLYLISKHPQVVARLEAEIDAVLGGRTPSVGDVRQLIYTQQVIKETLRLYPPVWMVGRQACERTELGGYDVPKGSYVFISQYAMHRHPDHWLDPEAFDPDRFAPDQSEPDRFVYFPFIRGRRQCIGDRFADMELALVLATLLQQYRFHLVPGHPVVIDPSVTLRPKHGLSMTIRPR